MTPSAEWKRRKADSIAEKTGRRFCMSCRTMKPTKEVRRYRGIQRGVILRCDSCQKLRLEVLQRKGKENSYV